MEQKPVKITDIKSIKQIKNIKTKSRRDIIREEIIKRRLLINKYRNNFRLISAISVIVLLSFGIYIANKIINPVPIPSSIVNSVKFAIFYPQPNKQIVYQKGSFEYDKSKGQVIFNIHYDGQEVTFSEQSSPDAFSANPNYYQSLVSGLNNYATFASINGQVNLTIPSQTKQQTAIMNTKGTLLFVNSRGDLNENNWKILFASLKYTQQQ